MLGHSGTIRRITTGFAAAAALIAASVATIPRSEAGIPAPWDVHKKIHKHVERRAHRLLDLPRRIHARHVSEFRNFYSGRSYYGPHRHFHKVYRYPVYVGHRVVYRPYSYCNDDLFVQASVGLPRISVSVYPGNPIYYGPSVVSSQPLYYEDRCDHDRGPRYDRDRYDRHRGHDDHDDHDWDD